MSIQNDLLVYNLSKAIAAAEVDYARLDYLNADFCLVRDSGHQELDDWKYHHLEELLDLMYSANHHTTTSEAKEALRYMCVNSEYLITQDPEIQTLLENADRVLGNSIYYDTP